MIKNKYAVLAFIGIFLTALACQTSVVGEPGNNGSKQSLTEEIRREAEPYILNIAGWETANLVTLADVNKQKGSQLGKFQGLQENITKVLKEENIAVIPPVQINLEEPPPLLVVSPRDRIMYQDRILLLPGLSDQDINKVEEKVDSLSLSSLVVKLGGFGAAYPAIVSLDMAPKHIVNAAVEEWVHQYLVFKPLGFLYLLDLLGVHQDPVVIVMNETLAGMIAKEIGTKVYERYYFNTNPNVNGPVKAVFDFNREMRETRLKVDALLAAGRIEEAERYMENRRQYFSEHGYGIRKLNQAYFAFHGIYGNDPGSISPVYENMVKLRNDYTTLSGFIDKVSAMTRYRELEQSVNALTK